MIGSRTASPWLPPALFYVALLVAVIMATLPHPPQLPGNPVDKLQHIAAFAVLAFLGSAAYPRTPLLRIGERLSLLGVLIEVVQVIPALHRDCDIMDWVADTASIVVVLTLVKLGRRAWREYRGPDV
jgi:VanZ family protein